jgi:hypothetical protein
MSNPKGINQYTKLGPGAGMARSFHAGARKEFSRASAFNIMADTSKAGRRGIAQQIREIRRAPGVNHLGQKVLQSQAVVHTAVSSAAASTRLRNLHKMGKAR